MDVVGLAVAGHIQGQAVVGLCLLYELVFEVEAGRQFEVLFVNAEGDEGKLRQRLAPIWSESLFSIEQDFGCLNSIDYYKDGNSVVRLLNG